MSRYTYIACLVWIDPDKGIRTACLKTLSLRLINVSYLQRRGRRSGGVGSEFVSASLLKVGSSGMIQLIEVSGGRNAFLFRVKQSKKIRVLFEPEDERSKITRNLY